MLRSVRLPIALSVAALCAAAAIPATAASATPAKACGSSAAHSLVSSLAGGYIYHLTVQGGACATGRQVEVAFQACRLKHGQKGKCTAKVVGFTCKEKRVLADSTSFLSSVSCTKGKTKVAFGFQQDTL